MKTTDTIIIGAGQAGLATSRCLQERGIDHVVLERGRIAERWRTERWDSLRLLTPNWQSRLPGWRYRGSDPDGYMTMPEVVSYLDDYAQSFCAPVLSQTSVLSCDALGDGYRISTSRGPFRARSVVVATGACGTPHVPAFGASLGADILQIVPSRYRNPDQLPSGGVLVVGASASGLQIAEELRAAGRFVTLAVGRHIRLPRLYRGRDVLWHLDRMGTLDERAADVGDLSASRRQPSLQLVGRQDHRSLDLGILQDAGVRLAGRAVGADDGVVFFSDDLGRTMRAADVKLEKVLRRIDGFVEARKHDLPAPEPLRRISIPETGDRVNLRRAGIRTVVWATGFRPSYPWLRVPLLGRDGQIRHEGGVTPAAGLFVLGLPFLRRRKSTFLDGVGDDAREITAEITQHLGAPRRVAA